MKTHEAADLLGIATSTIRAWSTGEFRQYLSPSAQGGDGRFRNLTQTDARIIAFIASLKSESRPRDEIHAALKRLQAEDWADLPPLPPAPAGVGPIPMIPREAAETAVTSQRSALLREIAILQERVQSLDEQLASERQRREDERLKAQEAREVLLREVAEAQRKLAESEVELRLWRAGRLKPEE
jgi:DNA-binding transcriptional MerR regulator